MCAVGRAATGRATPGRLVIPAAWWAAGLLGGTPMSKLERPAYRSRSVNRLISKGMGSLGRAVAPRGDLGLISSSPIENQLKPRFTVICLDPYDGNFGG